MFISFVCVAGHLPQCTWESEENLEQSVLSFHLVDPRDRTQIVRLGSKHLYLLSPFTGPKFQLLESIPKVSIVLGRHKTSKNE